MYSNFNVTSLNSFKENIESNLTSFLKCLRDLEVESFNIYSEINIDNSDLAIKWNNLLEDIKSHEEQIEDLHLSIKNLLKEYIDNTIENEKKAQVELDIIDNNINDLYNDATLLLEGLNAMKGIGLKDSSIDTSHIS